MANEIEITAKLIIEPDLSGYVLRPQRRRRDIVTKEWLPAKQPCYYITERYNDRLIKRYVSIDTFESLGIPKP